MKITIDSNNFLKTVISILLSAMVILSNVLLLPTATEAVAVESEENAVYIIKDFYSNGKDRRQPTYTGWWDGENSPAATGTKFTYSDDDRYMTVEYNGNYIQSMITGSWYQILPRDRDWTAAKFMMNEIKNVGNVIGEYKLVVTTGTIENSINHYMRSGSMFYLKTKGGQLIPSKTKMGGSINIPIGFDGWVIVPIDAYPPTLDLKKMLIFSFDLVPEKTGTLRFGLMGYAVSEKILTEDPIICDNTVYGLPEVPDATPLPEREPNEPADSLDNNIE